MKTHREILRHALDLKLSGNQTQSVLGVSRGTVQDCLKRARAANLISWDQIESIADEELFATLFPDKKSVQESSDLIEWERIFAESKRRGVKLRLLYEEIVDEQNRQLSYSQFCRRFRQWSQSKNISMRQEHIAGENLFVDFSGMTVAVTDPDTGEVNFAQIFVATFGASNYTYFEAVLSQRLQDWIEAHIRAFKFFGGVPKFVVPDNLKAAVIDAERFDPIVNRTYQRFAAHYKVGIKPARPYKPKDKAKVEKGVQNTEYRALARLRNRTFFSLHELNRELAILRAETNAAPYQKLSGSRASWFEDVERPALRPLPDDDFEFEDWIVGYRVPSDYHVNVLGHFYSVPFTLANKVVDVRFTKHFVEVLHGNTRVASHPRNWMEGTKSTAEEHLAPAHALYHGLTPDYFLQKAGSIGPNTRIVVHTLLQAKPYPQLSYAECFGIIKELKSSYGEEELEMACEQAIRLNSIGYRVVKSILEAGVRNLPDQLTLRLGNKPHENLRGARFYH
ncbi:MAG: IS21 family transposase [Candidatus Obscuribacterales bacterium]